MTVFNYWVICYVPDAARPDKVSAGVVVTGTAPGEIAFKAIDRASALPALGGSREQFYMAINALHDDLNRFAQPDELPLGATREVFNYMERMRRQNYGIIQFQEPGLVVDTDVAVAADKLYDRLVHRLESSEPQPRRLTLLKRATENAYTQYDLLKDKVVTHPKFSVNNYEENIDFAVLSNEVWELSSAFTFGNADKAVRNRMMAWSYAMGKVRKGGGLVEPKKADPVPVSTGVPITAIVDRPKSIKQNDLFLSVVPEWKDLGIEHVFKDNLETHAAQLNRHLERVA